MLRGNAGGPGSLSHAAGGWTGRGSTRCRLARQQAEETGVGDSCARCRPAGGKEEFPHPFKRSRQKRHRSGYTGPRMASSSSRHRFEPVSTAPWPRAQVGSVGNWHAPAPGASSRAHASKHQFKNNQLIQHAELAQRIRAACWECHPESELLGWTRGKCEAMRFANVHCRGDCSSPTCSQQGECCVPWIQLHSHQRLVLGSDMSRYMLAYVGWAAPACKSVSAG